jgi:transcriptional regulator with XRE-family HTH domain
MEKSVFTHEYLVFLRSLREARERAGMTQAQLADRLGQTQSWVSKCERGERRLDIVEVRAFCEAMEIQYVAFVGEFDEEIHRLRRKLKRT